MILLTLPAKESKDKHTGLFTRFLAVSIVLLAIIFYPAQSEALTLEFDQVLTDALDNAYDLKIATADIDLKTIRVDEAFATYYPTLGVRLGNEYLHDLDHGSNGSTYVGTTYISGSQSTYQHSLSFNLNYNLYDFGARGRKYDNVMRDVDLAGYAFSKSKIDLEVKVLDLFTEGLKLTSSTRAYREILNRRQEIYAIEQRKFAAGSTQKIQVAEAAVAIAETLKQLTDSRMRSQNVLKEISVITRQEYEAETTGFADFSATTASSAQRPDIAKLPEIIAYDLDIQKKTAEYEIIDLERYPKLTMYADYKLYGQDENNFYDSFQDLSRKNASIGIIIDLPLFQGFATIHKARGLQKEIEKLRLERGKRIAELTAQIDSLIASDQIFQESGTERRECLENSAQLQDMARRLNEQQLTERLYYLRTQVDLLEKQLDIRLKEIDWAANSRRLLFLSQEEN